MRKRNNIDGVSVRKRKVPVKTQERTVHVEERKRVPEKKVRKIRHKAPRLAKNTHCSSVWLKILRVAAPIVLGIIAAAIAINQFDSASVRIHPHRDLVAIDSSTTLHKSAGIAELDFSVIAITDTIEIPVEADTEVAVNKYASGTIRIFNEYSTAPQRLSPKTRFESVDGKIYMLSDEEGLVIPGRTDEGPGETTATVYASEPGESYNIDVTDFSIPGFDELGLDEKYSNIYALSVEPFTGGYVGTRPAVSEELQTTHTQQLQENLVEELQHQLANDKTFGMSVIENTTRIELKDVSFTAAQDDTEGTLSLSGTLYALLVSKEKLGTYLAQQELSMSDDEKVTLDESSTVTVSYRGDDISYETIEDLPVTIAGEALFVWQPNIDMVASQLVGIPKNAIAPTSNNIRSIGKITIKNHPRWRTTLPNTAEAINVRVISN